MRFLPLINKLVNVFTERAVQVQTANNRVLNHFFVDLHEFNITRYKAEIRKEAERNRLLPQSRMRLPRKAKIVRKPQPSENWSGKLRKASSLSILTSGGQFIRGFANKSHFIMNDIIEPILRMIAEFILKTVQSFIERNVFMETSELQKHLRHIYRLGRRGRDGAETFKFACYTTCGYVVLNSILW